MTRARRPVSPEAGTGRGDYGIDAPRALMAVSLPGVAGLAVVAVGITLGWAPGLMAALGAVVVVDLVIVGTFLHATRVGKHRVWAEVLDSLRWRGDELGLDLGCGRGAVMIALARRLPRGHVTGLDIWDRVDQSGNAPDLTQRNAVAEGVADRVTVATGDLRDLDLPTGTFDVVTTSLVLHNLPTSEARKRVLQHAMKVLKPGGRLLVADIRNIDEYRLVLEQCGAEDLAVRRSGVRACFGIPRLRVIVGSKPGSELAVESDEHHPRG